MSLKNSKITVIKIGSSLLIDHKKRVRKKWLTSFAEDVKNLRKLNQKIVIVSSGAIAMGCKKMNILKKNLKLDKSQRMASIGQIELMNLFSEIFSKFKINISQILLTLEDTEQRRRSINVRRTFENLFNLNYIPVVYENDTIATSEIKYGDNDRLASRVAQISDADCLVLLSDVDGLYTKNPKIHKHAKLINKIEKIDQNIIKLASGKTSEYGSGGMRTKIDAAKICALSGCKMAIANGLKERPLSNILDKKICTWFIPEISKLDARKKWIASTLHAKGYLKIDEGAENALRKGKSLLAAGVKSVEGSFKKGDQIKIINKNDKELAIGLSSFSSEEINKIKGHQSNKIEELIGFKTKTEVVHKDDMVEI